MYSPSELLCEQPHVRIQIFCVPGITLQRAGRGQRSRWCWAIFFQCHQHLFTKTFLSIYVVYKRAVTSLSPSWRQLLLAQFPQFNLRLSQLHIRSQYSLNCAAWDCGTTPSSLYALTVHSEAELSFQVFQLPLSVKEYLNFSFKKRKTVGL